MHKQTSPQPKQQVPDPAHTYERTDPKRESGAGRLTNNTHATPAPRADKMPKAVGNAHDGATQLNADESAAIAAKAGRPAIDNEPLGWETKPKKH